MTDPTPLDRAHEAMQAAPDDDAARLRFFERLADAELFLLLEREAVDGKIDPRVFATGEGRFLLVFDREERLAGFAGGIAPYAALPGRAVAGLIAGTDHGLGLNLGSGTSDMLLPAAAVAWLAQTLASVPAEIEARPSELSPPTQLPESLIVGLDAKLAAMPGRARFAYLAAVVFDTGARGHLLAFIDPAQGAEPALARAVGETLAFSGLDAAALDVGFFRAADPIAARLSRVGLRFDLPQPSEPPVRPAPGSDPDRPPVLRTNRPERS